MNEVRRPLEHGGSPFAAHRQSEAPAPAGLNELTRILWGHSAFQYLAAGTELGLFELLAATPGARAGDIGSKLGLAERATQILMLGCTALGLVERNGDRYSLCDVLVEMFASGNAWQQFRDIVCFEQQIVYVPQVDFSESLRRNTNVGLRRIPGSAPDLYRRLGENPELQRVFYRFMSSWSDLVNHHLVDRLNLANARMLLDCGGGDGVNAIRLATRNPQLHVTIIEIPEAVDIARSRVSDAGLGHRISVVAGDMFTDEYPDEIDVVLFAHQFVIWSPEENTQLLRRAHGALGPGGRVAIFNAMSSDDLDGPFISAMCSVYFASLPADGGMVYSWRQHERWLHDAGFRTWERIECPGWTPTGLLVGTK